MTPYFPGGLSNCKKPMIPFLCISDTIMKDFGEWGRAEPPPPRHVTEAVIWAFPAIPQGVLSAASGLSLDSAKGNLTGCWQGVPLRRAQVPVCPHLG